LIIPPVASTAEETEGEEELEAVAPQSEPEQENENQASDDEAHDSVETTSVVEIPSLSRSSSLCTLTPVPRVEALTTTPDNVPTARPDVLLYSFHPLQ
jgi:hypothetical protein